MNPANYEAWIDPKGGEWIRLKKGEAKNVVFRPKDIHFAEDGRFGFDVEFFSGPGITLVTEKNSEEVYRYIQAIMTEIIAYEQAQLELLAKAEEQKNEQKNEQETTQNDYIASQFEQENAHRVSEELLPQDIQADLHEISKALGGIKTLH